MLRPIAPDLWHAESSVRLMPGAQLPTRMTVIRRTDGSLVLHSPVALSDALTRELQELGEVRCVIVPSCLHHLHAPAALEHFPKAVCLAARGVSRKNTRLSTARELDAAARELDDDIEAIQLGGMPNVNEWVFRHRKTGFLITTDLVFNLRESKGWLTPWVLRAAGTRSKLAVSRLFQREIRDEAAFFESLRRVLQEPVTGLVMSHGSLVEHDADAQFRHALAERFPRFEG